MEKTTNLVDAATMGRKATAHFGQGRNCAQATLLGICSATGSPISEELMLAITVGFGGGIGNTYDEGPCAALAGGVIFLGLHYGKNTRTIEMARHLYNDFKETYGSIQCSKVIERVRNHECIGCCLTVIDKVTNMMGHHSLAEAEQTQ